MNVRAKFYCSSMTMIPGGEKFQYIQYNYKFSAVTSGSDENKSFWKYTPAGNIELSSIKDNLFEVGKEYYLDFTLAE